MDLDPEDHPGHSDPLDAPEVLDPLVPLVDQVQVDLQDHAVQVEAEATLALLAHLDPADQVVTVETQEMLEPLETEEVQEQQDLEDLQVPGDHQDPKDQLDLADPSVKVDPLDLQGLEDHLGLLAHWDHLGLQDRADNGEGLDLVDLPVHEVSLGHLDH